jgi:hypothetical protein
MSRSQPTRVKRLTQEEMRALRHAGLSDEQISAISLAQQRLGMGSDEVHELMLSGARSPRMPDASRQLEGSAMVQSLPGQPTE